MGHLLADRDQTPVEGSDTVESFRQALEGGPSHEQERQARQLLDRLAEMVRSLPHDWTN